MAPRYRDIDAEDDWAADQAALAAELERDAAYEAANAPDPRVRDLDGVGGPPVFSTDPF